MPSIKSLFKARPEYQTPTAPRTHKSSHSQNNAPVTMDHLSSAMQATSLGTNSYASQSAPKSHHNDSFWTRTFTLPDPPRNSPPKDQNRPYHRPHLPPPGPSRTPSPTKSHPVIPLTPTKDSGSSANSSPRKRNSATATAQAVQCSGITSTGKRCTRNINASAAYQKSSPHPSPARAYSQLQTMLPLNEQDGQEVPLFCHQHAKQALSDDGIYAGPSGLYTRFDGQPYLGKPYVESH